ncbi:MAG: SRPBCC family protein [Deltaproteobacteria bacterium]|nr:SRPBCC family protein [Deltaproteobacteria bacterium]
MAEVSKSGRIEAAAADVWALVSEFNGLPAWLPPVAASETEGEGIGAVRTVTMQDGAKIAERLEAFDADAMTYTYSMTDMGPLPMAEYQSTMVVSPDGDGCTITWTGTFEPAGAPSEVVAELVGGLYDSGIGSVQEKLGKS